MSSSTNSLPALLSFPEDRKLAGTSNWAIFRDHLKSVARATGLTGYLDGSISPPSSTTTVSSSTVTSTSINSRSPSAEEWELRDGRLAGIIYQNIGDPRSIGVNEGMTANAMWNVLTSEYDTSSAAAQSLAKERIQKFRFDGNVPFEFYFKQLEALRKSASDVGCTVTDEDLRSRFLTSLSPDYLWIIQNHGSRTYSDLKRNLVEYDMMVESSLPESSRVNSTATNALAVASGYSKSNSGIVCENCKRSGHVKKNCWAQGGGSEGKAPRWYHAPKGMEPAQSVTAVSVKDEENLITAATTYDFSDYDFGDWESKKTLPF